MHKTTTSSQPERLPTLPTLNLEELERLAVLTAIAQAPSTNEAAALLGITRHALRRRLLRFGYSRRRAAETR